MIELRRLEILAAAVRERSIAAAARSLDITPSAASQSIAALEAQTGTTLFHRVGRGVVPTPAGERLALHAEAIVSQLRQAEAELSGPPAGTLRLGAFATAVAGLLPDALRRLSDSGHGFPVHIDELEPDEARALLRRGELDLGLVNHDAVLAPDAGGPWRVEHIVDEPVLVVLPSTHPLARRGEVDLADLRDERWIMQAPASPCQEIVVRACAAQGFAPTLSATCRDYRSIVRLVECGLGVSLVPRLALQSLVVGDVSIRPTRTPITRRINALIPSGEHAAAAWTLLGLLRASPHL
jgi:DNA-binding transcriptional LysR family regulator